MVASIPKGVYTMKDRRGTSITMQTLTEKTSKKITDATLNEKSKRGRKKVYGKEVINALKKIWPLTGFASSKHLVAFIRLNHDLLFSHPHIKESITDKTKQLLLSISHATVDRFLKPYRDYLKLKKTYRSNPFKQ